LILSWRRRFLGRLSYWNRRRTGLLAETVEDRVASKIRNLETQIRVDTEALKDYVAQGGAVRIPEIVFHLNRNIDRMMTEKREWEWALNG
jgi:hypothetical protein